MGMKLVRPPSVNTTHFVLYLNIHVPRIVMGMKLVRPPSVNTTHFVLYLNIHVPRIVMGMKLVRPPSVNTTHFVLYLNIHVPHTVTDMRLVRLPSVNNTAHFFLQLLISNCETLAVDILAIWCPLDPISCLKESKIFVLQDQCNTLSQLYYKNTKTSHFQKFKHFSLCCQPRYGQKDTVVGCHKTFIQQPVDNVLYVSTQGMPNTGVHIVFRYLVICHRGTLERAHTHT